MCWRVAWSEPLSVRLPTSLNATLRNFYEVLNIFLLFISFYYWLLSISLPFRLCMLPCSSWSRSRCKATLRLCDFNVTCSTDVKIKTTKAHFILYQKKKRKKATRKQPRRKALNFMSLRIKRFLNHLQQVFKLFTLKRKN